MPGSPADMSTKGCSVILVGNAEEGRNQPRSVWAGAGHTQVVGMALHQHQIAGKWGNQAGNNKYTGSQVMAGGMRAVGAVARP